MADWVTIRVVLLGRRGRPLEQPPGRLLLVHGEHSFADLSEAVDVALGRWDLSPVHEFAVEGRRLVSNSDVDDGEDSDDVTVGEVGLRPGGRFTYTFDIGEGWLHECRVEAVDVDPLDEYGDVPPAPVPLYGWGTIPDQYGRVLEDDEDEEPVAADDDAADLAAWAEAETSSWTVVAEALVGVDRPRDDAALAAAAATLRASPGTDDWRYDVLRAASGLNDRGLPEDDEQLWLALAAGVASPRGVLPLDADAESAWAALEPADWAGAVIELARSGVGQPADAETVLQLINRCPEVEGGDLTPEDEEVLLAALETVLQLWTALGAVDADGALTALGCWGLPESLRLAWTSET